jgi:hypothetical protein
VAKKDTPEPQRLLELGPGMGLWMVHLDSLRERDVNARVMEDDKFRRLAANIQAEGALESFPLVHLKHRVVIENEVEKQVQEFEIISGHHRTRAARVAKILLIPVIVIERELTESEITAKQLAHNALAGHDDLETLRQLYNSIEDPIARMSSGLTDLDLKIQMATVPTDALEVDFEFQPIYVLFMSSALQRWEHLLDRLDPEAKMYAANHDDWERFVKLIRQTSKLQDVRNIAGIMVAFMDYAERGIAAEAAERNAKKATDDDPAT